MVSTPSYDPSTLAVHSPSEANRIYSSLVADQTDPLINRAIGGDTYAPGSTFKLIVAAAALDSGYTPDTLVYAPPEPALPGPTAPIKNYGRERCGASDKLPTIDPLSVCGNHPLPDLPHPPGWGVHDTPPPN